MIGASIGISTVSGCTTQQSNQDRSIRATEHIQSPIRTLEARAELEIAQPWESGDDELLARIVPDALAKLSPGSPGYQRALTAEKDVPLGSAEPRPSTKRVGGALNPQRKSRAVKLYTQARQLSQSGQIQRAGPLLVKAAKLDPGSETIQRALGETLLLSNDRVGGINALRKALELGDRSPRVLVVLAGDASSRDNQLAVISLSREALASPTINRQPMTRSIARVFLGTAEINAGYLKAGAQTLGDALETFDTRSRELRWKREIIQIMSQRAPLWILVGDAWASIGAHQRALDAYSSAGLGLDRPPVALLARQIASSLRQGHPSGAALMFLDHLQNNAADLGPEELVWARALASVDGLGDVLGSAIDELISRPGLPPSIRRSLLRIELNALDTPRALGVLASAGVDANDALIALGVLARIPDEAQRTIGAVLVLETNPTIARAIASGFIRTLDRPVEFLRTNEDPGTPGAQLLVASVGIALGRPDLIGHLDAITDVDLSARSTPWLGVHAQSLALTGRWTQVQPLLDELRTRAEHDNPQAVRTLASTLLIAQRPDRAWSLIQEEANTTDATNEDLMLGAQIAQSLKNYEDAANFLERALEHDPYDEKIYEQLFVLRSSSSPIGDEDELRQIVRQLSTARPRSSLLGLIRASELARNGLIDEAESLLIELNTASRHREIGYDLLLSIWKTKQSQGQPQTLADGIAWLESRRALDPNSVQGLMTIAQGLFELEAHQRSLDMLEDGYASTGSFEIARAIEQLLAGPLDRGDDARRHADDRLVGLMGIDPTIEYANLLARDKNKDEADQLIALLKDGFPAPIKLLPAQRTQLEKIVFTLAGTIETLHTERQVLDAISIIESHTDRLGFQLWRIKLILLAQEPVLEMDRLVDQIKLALSQEKNEDNHATLRLLSIQSLLGEDRPHEAIVLSSRMGFDTGVLDDNAAIETYQLLAEVGTNADMIGVLDKLDKVGLMDQMIALAAQRVGTPQRKPAVTPGEQRAELAYIAAALTSVFDRPAQADSYYELALSYNPDHAWANNDYGYILAERGERMEQAVEMLERAARLLPDEASVIDSLGWVRYKMGIFEDFVTPSGAGGGRTIRGAISLLTRANELDTKRENATIILHLGDALWRGGYQDKAIEAWLGAEDILRDRSRSLSAEPKPNQRAQDALNTELREIRTRIQDADSTSNPTLAPLVAPPLSTPESVRK